MKYTKPTLEVVELEITDVIAASGEQGSITVDDTTITGPYSKGQRFSAAHGAYYGWNPVRCGQGLASN